MFKFALIVLKKLFLILYKGWPVISEDANGWRMAGTVRQIESLDLTHQV